MADYQSWGRYPRAVHQRVLPLRWRADRLPLPDDPDTTVLPYGLGRSQGDSCLNDGGVLLDTRELNHFISFSATTGRLRCEAGVTLASIVDEWAPRGWFLPVTPGTKYVTVGGAIANDVHGKNHHRAGTFGCHVTQFELLRSDGQRRRCSPTEHADLFAATIGGLGLTGLITWAELQLRRMPSEYMTVTVLPYATVPEGMALAQQHLAEYEYIVGQFNAIAASRLFGQGVLMLGNHADASSPPPVPSRTVSIPLTAPNWLLNDWSMALYNTWYHWRQTRGPRQRHQHYDPYFYPLDGVRQWNRLYGQRGFVQYQAAVPSPTAAAAITDMLAGLQQHGLSSYLASLKFFGPRRSPGLLSFPRPGIAVALDLPMRGSRTLELLDAWDSIITRAGGSVYPAKDARVGAAVFQRQYPAWQEFSRYVDPRFSSSFWRRVVQ